MTKNFCDKCAHEVVYPARRQVVLLDAIELRLDLCEACFARAKEWLRTHPAEEKF